MFKKLFGRKKNQPESLEEAKEALLENIKEEALNKHIPKSLEDLMNFFATEENDDKIADIKQSIFSLIDVLPPAQSVQAFTTYSNLLDRLGVSVNDTQQVVDLYDSYLQKSIPFFNILSEEVKKGEEGDSEHDIDSIHYQLIRDRERVSEEVAKSVVVLNPFSQNVVDILSVDASYIALGKEKVGEIVKQIKDYNQGAYWVDRLFSVLFEEPLLVIDVDNHVGFEGKMSGIGDNVQLQLFLMSMPELNEHSALTERDFSVVNGTGIHMSPAVIDGKWNLYNWGIIEEDDWDDIKVGPAKTLELQDYWIWGEGTPQEIATRDGKRAVLLGRPTYKRPMKLQRAFKNLKASIEVERILTEDEISEYLGIKD